VKSVGFEVGRDDKREPSGRARTDMVFANPQVLRNPTMIPLFDSDSLPPFHERLEEGALLLHGFAIAEVPVLIEEVALIAQAAVFRNLVTPGGYTMSVAMTNCGRLGWVSDRTGYRYDPADPATGVPWPAMPAAFLDIAVRAASEAGFANYDPDACLINRYIAGAKLGLHQDRDEKDAWAPIVSVSLGLPAIFLWGGKRRSDPVRRLPLESGDVAVWGGPARFVYHGVAPLKDGLHPLTGVARINLTFRKVF
jgi:alkylated DNA repair protein (DNA oxidative demethylase)